MALLLAGARGGRAAAGAADGASAMVGRDGLTVWYGHDDDVASATWSRTTGAARLASSGPDALGWWSVVTRLDRLTTELARFSWSADDAHGDEVFSLVGGEVRREVLSVGGVGRIYVGGRLELPRQLTAGSTWSSQGSVIEQRDGVTGSATAYTSTGTAAAAADAGFAAAGCLDVTVTETVGSDTSTTDRTWCPGSGIVSFVADAITWISVPAPAASSSTTSTPFDWDGAADLRFSSTTLSPVGTSLRTMTGTARPGVLSDGTIVAELTENNDIVALDPDATTGTKDRTVWRAHPGGTILSAVTLGELTVATTSDRAVVAYGPTGVALWRAPTPDTVGVRAVAFGGYVVVAASDGTVLALDPSSGAEVWRAQTPQEIRLTPVVASDSLVVVDDSGTILCLDTQGATRWQTSQLPAGALTVSAGVVVLAERGGITLRGYDLATGTKLWRTWEPLSLSSLDDVDGVVVGRGVGAVRGYDPATGQPLWTRTGRLYDVVAAGGRLVVLTEEQIVVLGRDGATTEAWSHGLESVPLRTSRILVGPTSVAAMTSWQLYRGVLS